MLTSQSLQPRPQPVVRSYHRKRPTCHHQYGWAGAALPGGKAFGHTSWLARAQLSAFPLDRDASALSLRICRTPMQIGGLAVWAHIASILGTAFWEGEGRNSPLDAVAAAVYGWQLALQMLWMHTVYWDSTVTVLAETTSSDDSKTTRSSSSSANAQTSEVKQIVGTAVLQLKVTGQELHEACSCELAQPVVIISNVAVAAGWRRLGVGRRIIQAAEATAIQLFCKKTSEAAVLAVDSTPHQLQGQQEDQEGSTLGQSVASQPESDSQPVQLINGTSVEQQHIGAREPQRGSVSTQGGWGAWWQTQPAVFLALIVYKNNDGAIRLYRECGWQEAVSWVDKAWQAEAEKGKPGSKPRRLLYVKGVQGCTPPQVLERLA